MDVTNYGITYTLFAIFTTIINLGVLVTILSNRTLRNRGPYIVIAVISSAHFIMGCFVYSFFSYSYLFSITTIDCSALMAAGVISFVSESVTMYNLLLLFINHLQQKRNQNESSEKTSCLIGSMAIIVLSIIVFPSVLVTQSATKCTPILPINTNIAVQCIDFFVPAFFLCVAGIVTIISHATTNRPPYLAQPGEMPRPSSFPSHIVVASFLAVITAAPTSLISVLRLSCIGFSCSWYFNLVEGFSFFSSASTFLIPFAWLLDFDYRMACKGLFLRQTIQVTSSNVNPPMTVYYNQPHMNMYVTQPTGSPNQYAGAYAATPPAPPKM